MNEALPQHLSALGFERNPFPQTPDADCYFRTESLERQFAEALHCLNVGKGFILITGEVGTGKSTFLRCLMDELIQANGSVSFVFNTFLQGRDLLLAINRDFGLAPGTNLAQDIDRLNQYLIAQHVNGRQCVVVIDDAQNLDAASLELLRLLSNLETRQSKLLQIVLSGQPELLVLLRKNEIRQLASRIVQHIELAPLSRQECERYIGFRITRSGTHGRVRLNAAAHRAAHRHSRGNPRRVHLIMDRCMYGVAPAGSGEVGKALVDQASQESGISHRHRRLPVGWSLVGLAAGAVIGVTAWVGVEASSASAEFKVNGSAPPSAIASAPRRAPIGNVLSAATNIDDSGNQGLQACLQKLQTDVSFAALNADVAGGALNTLVQAMAKDGVVTSLLPEGTPWPDRVATQSIPLCQWSKGGVRRLLWRSAHLPFELSDGARGESIRWLQLQLIAHDVYTAPVDGLAGWRTLAALNVFQRQHGLNAQSVVDSWTLFLLEHGAVTPAV